VVRDDRFYPVDEIAIVDPAVSPTTAVHINLVPRTETSSKTASKRVSGSNPYIVDLSEYQQHFPKNAVKEFQKGVAADREKNTDAAIRHYEKCLKLAPDFYPAHNNLGSNYVTKSNFAGAERQFREAIRLNQGDSQAQFNLANVLILTSKFAEAERVLFAGLQRTPESAFGHFLLGSLYSRTGHLPQAERNLAQARQLDPLMAQSYLQLVNLYVQENRRSDAVAELQNFLRVFPEGPYTAKAKEVLKRLQSNISH
jgi:tetratricopeptide (TPR) repeat protein